MVPHPESQALPLDAVRAKLTAAILYLDLVLETVSDERARARLDAALRATWGAVDRLESAA